MAKTPTKPKGKKQSAAEAEAAKPRVLQKPQYRSFRLHKRIKGDPLPGAFRVMKEAFTTLARRWRLFLTVVAIYAVLNVAFVQGFQFAMGGVTDVKATLDELFSGGWGQFTNGLMIFALLLGSVGNTSDPTASLYQLILTVMVSLAMIWLLRQVYAGHKVRARDGFYRGMTPLVSFILVLLVIVLQLIPIAVGLGLYTTVMSSGIAATAVEQLLWALLASLLALLSLYMVSSSLFALYIVTLPDMTPMRALRSARQLVAYRRWTVMRKVLFLPLALVVMAGAIVLPFILFVTPVAPWAFLLLTMFFIPVAHSYLYALYRAML
jgi:hypothetical protein